MNKRGEPNPHIYLNCYSDLQDYAFSSCSGFGYLFIF